jgi:hypothetical protein
MSGHGGSGIDGIGSATGAKSNEARFQTSYVLM